LSVPPSCSDTALDSPVMTEVGRAAFLDDIYPARPLCAGSIRSARQLFCETMLWDKHRELSALFAVPLSHKCLRSAGRVFLPGPPQFSNRVAAYAVVHAPATNFSFLASIRPQNFFVISKER
jgi:hypothetical protein